MYLNSAIYSKSDGAQGTPCWIPEVLVVIEIGFGSGCSRGKKKRIHLGKECVKCAWEWHGMEDIS